MITYSYLSESPLDSLPPSPSLRSQTLLLALPPPPCRTQIVVIRASIYDRTYGDSGEPVGRALGQPSASPFSFPTRLLAPSSHRRFPSFAPTPHHPDQTMTARASHPARTPTRRGRGPPCPQDPPTAPPAIGGEWEGHPAPSGSSGLTRGQRSCRPRRGRQRGQPARTRPWTRARRST